MLLDTQILKFVRANPEKRRAFIMSPLVLKKRGWRAVGRPADMQGAEIVRIPGRDRIIPERGIRNKRTLDREGTILRADL